MKKPIDPNLNSNESEDILFNGGYDENKIIEVEQSSISDKTQNDIQTQTNELNKIVEKTADEIEHRHHHHHHSSSGEHRHSHSHHSSHSSKHHKSHKHKSSASRKLKRKWKNMSKWIKVPFVIILIIAILVGGIEGALSYIKYKGKNDFVSATITDKITMKSSHTKVTNTHSTKMLCLLHLWALTKERC